MSAVKAVKKDDSDATTGAGDEAAPLPIPNLALAQHYFHLAQPSLTHLHENAAKELLSGIEADEMAPYLATLLETDASLLPPAAKKLLPELEAKNKEALANFDKELTESEESMGETEVSDVLRRKAAYLAQIGDKTRSLAALSLALEKTPGLGARIDINLTILRIGFFFADHALVEEYLPKADALIKEGGDYDRRNRLSLYRARHLLSLRQFSTAAPLLIDALTTFAATELMSWDDLVGLAVLAGVVGLERGDVKAKIIDSPEVRQSFPERPVLEDFAGSLYACDYARFFRSLADVEQTLLLPSRILSAHARYYIREMRIKAYAQLLESYRSLTMDSMCAAFGVGPEFMDNDLSRLISSGRLNCTIDKVNGVVETNRRDRKNAQYEQVIKQGDLLLNSLSKLSKVIV